MEVLKTRKGYTIITPINTYRVTMCESIVYAVTVKYSQFKRDLTNKDIQNIIDSL